MNYYYTTESNEVAGPCSLEELMQLNRDGKLSVLAQVCPEGEEQWQPLPDFLASQAPAVAVIPDRRAEVIDGRFEPMTATPLIPPQNAPTTNVTINHVSTSDVRQGAVIGGWLCFLLGCGVMYFSLWAFFIYVPLLLVAFILSIAALSQRRILGGITLLLLTLIVPPVQWFCTAMIRSDKFLKSHLPADKALEYELKKKESQQLASQIINPPVETRAKVPTPDTPTPAVQEEVRETPGSVDRPRAEAAIEKPVSAVESPPLAPVVELSADSAPVVYEFKAPTPTPRETIARYVLGYDYRDMDEFSKHDFVSKLGAMIQQRADAATPETLYMVSVLVNLKEYDFDKQAFPVGDNPAGQDKAKYRSIRIAPNKDGNTQSNTDYVVCFPNSEAANYVPVSLDEAKTFAGTLRKSRQAQVSYVGTLQNCAESKGSGSGAAGSSTKYLLLDLREVRLTLKQSGQTALYKVPDAPPAAAADPANPTPSNGAPGPAPLTAEDISNWNLDRIKSAINEIYGRYGVEFPKAEVQAWADHQTWYHRVAGRTPDMAEQMFTETDKANVDLLAARRNVLRSVPLDGSGSTPVAVAHRVPVPGVPPPLPVAPTPMTEVRAPSASLDGIPELSPERAVTDVWDANPDVTTARFRSLYAGKVVRYTGTVVRKNPKERLLIFGGGGFMNHAYDVQLGLNEEKTPGFQEVAVGDRIIVVATIDRIVPPALGLGSNSIRLSDGWVYKKVR